MYSDLKSTFCCVILSLVGRALRPGQGGFACERHRPGRGRLRPEAVAIGSGSVPAEIRVVEDLGAEVFVHVSVPHEGGHELIVAKSPAPFAGRPGEMTTIDVVGAVHVFDPAGPRVTTARRAVERVAR